MAKIMNHIKQPKWQSKKYKNEVHISLSENRGRPPMVNKLKFPIKSNEIDLCADISEQPINFANWFHSFKMSKTKLKLKLTPEVLQAIEDCKKQQEAILELKIIDWEKLDNTYITI